MNFVKGILPVVIYILSCGNLSAQETEESKSSETKEEVVQAINICPGGLALGIISMNYERLISPSSGLMFRADYEAVPKTYSAANIKPYGMAFILNYRYHIGGGLNSYFLGSYARYREYRGKGELGDLEFDFKMPDLTFGLNLGRRWVWNSGLSITAAFGYGFSVETQKMDFANQDIRQAISVFEEQYDFINPFLGEISIGYAF